MTKRLFDAKGYSGPTSAGAQGAGAHRIGHGGEANGARTEETDRCLRSRFE